MKKQLEALNALRPVVEREKERKLNVRRVQLQEGGGPGDERGAVKQ